MVSVLGLATLYAVSDKSFLASTNETAAHVLGSLLLFYGVFSFTLSDDIEVDLNHEKKTLHYQVKNILGKKSQDIPFSGIEKILIHRVGKESTYTRFHFISIKLKNGKSIKTGRRFLEEEDAYKEANAMAKIIECNPVGDFSPPKKTNKEKILNTIIAFIGSVFLYAFYYRGVIGPWSEGMWFGMLPPVFILMSSLILFYILARLKKY